jgi:protoporphyrinogen oxidase
MTQVVILGGGPAGCGGAWKLRAEGKAAVTLVERGESFGGNAGSFEWHGHVLDYGSHRLHPATDPAIMADIKGFLGDDLLDRPRHGRIRLLGRWIHFPLKPADLLLHLPPRFAAGTAADIARKTLPRKAQGPESFASVLGRSLGRTICDHFYFPYARKIWGRDPAELSAIQAYKRVSAGSVGKLIRKVVGQVPGFKKPGAGRFYYPRGGFGQISTAYAQAAAQLGADIMTGWTATGLAAPSAEHAPWRVRVRRATEERTLECDHLWSTLPITVVARTLSPAPQPDVLAAAGALDYRAMVLVYLELDAERFSEFDAHYFPGEDIVMTRLSEPKNYAVRSEPKDRTVLCAEVPCAVGDAIWSSGDAELGRIIAQDLARTGLPLARPPIAVTTQRLPQAYPIYVTGYEKHFGTLDRWADTLPRFVSYGRQGLFAHDNTHHALAMAYGAASCLASAGFDVERWHALRGEFAKHVVED